MEQRDIILLKKDLCARLPYSLKVCLYEKETCILTGIDGYEVYLDIDSDSFHIEAIKPYLRPMSSMTREEKGQYQAFFNYDGVEYPEEYVDWLNAHYFDYRGLIEKGLALEAPDGMYKIKGIL